jgi:hypothetical protein
MSESMTRWLRSWRFTVSMDCPLTSSDGPTTGTKRSSSLGATPVSRDGGPDLPCRGPRPDRLSRHWWERHGRNTAAPGPDPTWVLAHTRSRTLPDGTDVVLRPILPQDKPYLVSILRRMSAESRRLRFHHAKTRLTRGELRYLSDPVGAESGRVICQGERRDAGRSHCTRPAQPIPA